MKLIKDFMAAIKDSERDFSERIFLCLTLASEVTVLIAFIVDLLTKEGIVELIVLAATLVLVPLISLICLHKDKLKIAVRMIVVGLVFAIIPLLFFFGGGVEGGGVLWIIFAFMYAGLVVSGGLRMFAFVALTLITVFCYIVEYYHPELVVKHSRKMFFIDSLTSIILVGAIGFLMTWVQRVLFRLENNRAKKEAERAEELTRSQNRFFSSMSHEIRTPINSILGLNELILRDETASDEIVSDAKGIQGSGKMLLALINDILDFSKMEAGSMDIVPVDYRVGDMLSEIVNMLWLKAHEKGLKMDVSVDPNVPTVLYGDEVRIKQVIVNLFNNAVKYTADGSVGLRIENEELGEDYVVLRISVTDTGMGIKKEALPYLFDAFKRMDQEKNRMIEGTGLGLSIVKQIVELMDGTVSVNSVYGEGSTFTVIVRQGISDPTAIGELNIHNQQTVRVSAYESSFMAPEAAILIVDDNEMNLEVESRLLEDTGMVIDKALSGKEALEIVQRHHYDVILMDHLMPEMDGIECLEKLRRQQGGLNRTTPVVVLTANAGSENRELYSRAGFDGYLVKPVSGTQLEDILIKFIPQEKLIMNSGMMSMHEDIDAAASYSGKAPVIITSTSMCDLPDRILKNLNLNILPFLIRTTEGVFKDGVQMEAGELIRYMKQGGDAISSPPDETTYTEFFANALKRAHHLIHISISTGMSEDYKIASEAARSFENVTVINSEGLSSTTGILVLIAYKLAQQNIPVEEIVAELEEIKSRFKCSFVIDTTDFMVKKQLISPRVHKIANALNMHPCLRLKKDKSGVGGIWFGSTKRAYRKYINRALPADVIPDSDVVFITYVDMPAETLQWIKEEISRKAYFERVVFQQASAAISSNCGPGTFGILYFVKGNKSYNLGSFFEDENEDERASAGAAETMETEEVPSTDMPEEADEFETETPEEHFPDTVEDAPELSWYQKLDFIDGEEAIKNSGSEDSLKTVIKIFYDSVAPKTEEIEGYYGAQDWKNYTIKVHALKSSARIIGAGALADEAQRLENAGKEENIDYIRENHARFMQDYHELGEKLAPLCEAEEEPEAEAGKPLADEFLMESVFEGLKDAADSMSCDDIDEILGELADYSVPEEERKLLADIKQRADNFDYDGILELLKTRTN